jgi:hypothetical protein
VIRILNMAPSSIAQNKQWFIEPWVLESTDSSFMSFKLSKKATPGEDGDGEVICDNNIPQA